MCVTLNKGAKGARIGEYEMDNVMEEQRLFKVVGHKFVPSGIRITQISIAVSEDLALQVADRTTSSEDFHSIWVVRPNGSKKKIKSFGLIPSPTSGKRSTTPTEELEDLSIFDSLV